MDISPDLRTVLHLLRYTTEQLQCEGLLLGIETVHGGAYGVDELPEDILVLGDLLDLLDLLGRYLDLLELLALLLDTVDVQEDVEERAPGAPPAPLGRPHHTVDHDPSARPDHSREVVLQECDQPLGHLAAPEQLGLLLYLYLLRIREPRLLWQQLEPRLGGGSTAASLLLPRAFQGLHEGGPLLPHRYLVAAPYALEYGNQNLRPDVGGHLDQALDGNELAEVLTPELPYLYPRILWNLADPQMDDRLDLGWDQSAYGLLAGLDDRLRFLEKVKGKFGIEPVQFRKANEQAPLVRIIVGNLDYPAPVIVFLEKLLPLGYQILLGHFNKHSNSPC